MGDSTIQDVAAAAGVSTATVSRVLNGKRVRDEAYARTMEAIGKIGYVPAPRQRKALHLEGRLLGIIVPQITDPYYSVVVGAALDAAAESGTHLIVKNCGGVQQEEERFIRELTKLPLSGLIYCPSATVLGTKILADFKAFPVVVLGRRGNDDRYKYVYYDYQTAGYIAAKYLIKLGHRKILYVGSTYKLNAPVKDGQSLLALSESDQSGFYHSSERFIGFRRALEEAGMGVDLELVRICGYDWPEGYRLGQEVLGSMMDFDAIIAPGDLVAAGIIKCFNEQNIKIPQDVSLISFNDTSLSQVMNPSLTSIAQDMAQIGRIAVEMSLGSITDRVRVLDVALQVRNSTGMKN